MPNKFASALNGSGKGERRLAATSPDTTEKKSPHERPARRGAKHIGGYFSPEVSKQLRQIALDEDSSVQTLLAEGIDMVFQARRKPTIAQGSVK